MSIEALLYQRPNREIRKIEIDNIREDDALYINENAVLVSLEDCGQFNAIYFDDGHKVDDQENEEPDEIIICSLPSESCESAMSRGVQDIKERKKQNRPIFTKGA